MKPNSYRMAIAIALCLSIFSITPGTAHKSSLRTADNTFYYFYSSDDDGYQGHTTTATEIVYLQTIYGVPVDTNPFGGTLLARGYTSNIVPHQIWPSVFMYGHF